MESDGTPAGTVEYSQPLEYDVDTLMVVSHSHCIHLRGVSLDT